MDNVQMGNLQNLWLDRKLEILQKMKLMFLILNLGIYFWSKG
jgi:hypothetical protein